LDDGLDGIDEDIEGCVAGLLDVDIRELIEVVGERKVWMLDLGHLDDRLVA
jgi:hypothetical protein